MAGPIARWGAVLGLGALWWWAVLRLALASDAGALEGAVAAGGWGLSLLPVHCVPKDRAVGAVASGRWAAAWRPARATAASPHAQAAAASPRAQATAASPRAQATEASPRAQATEAATTASPHRRSDAESGLS